MSFQAEARAEENNFEALHKRNNQLTQKVAQLQRHIEEIPKDALAVMQCCKALGISAPTWYKLRKEGKTPQTFSIDGVKRQFVLKDVFTKWLKDRAKQGVNHDFGSPRKIKFDL